MTITVEWHPPKRFEGVADSGARLVMDARVEAGGGGAGPTPMETVLCALAGCTGIDVVEILTKMRAGLQGLTVSASAERAADHPRVFTKIHLRYVVWGKDLAREQVERAMALSREKYCSVSAMLSHTATLSHELILTDRPPT